MHKLIVSASALAILLTGSVVSAQSYYPTYQPATTSVGCTVITRDLSIGARGSDVTTLQRFLVAQNYAGGGAWMITGYFGAATQAALRNYESQHYLPITGVADAATRAAIAANCGYTNSYNPYPIAPTYPTYPTYPTTPVYPTTPSYPYQGAVSITSLSMNSATPNTSVTVYGTGFQYGNTVVHIGGTSVAVSGNSGTNSLSFYTPNLTPGSYQLTVSTAYGTSNALPFTITPAYPCGTYPYGTSCGGCTTNMPNYNNGLYGYNYGSGTCPGAPLSVSFLSPNSGAIGTSVTVYGTGFSTNGNTVHFGNGIIANLSSFDGTSVTFVVPTQLTGFGGGQVVLATYNVSVSNAVGQTSNALPFTVTSLGSAGAPTITGLSGPSSLQTGVSGTWTLNVNTQAPVGSYTSVTVNWGDNSNGYANTAAPQTVYGQSSQTLSFSHSYATAGNYMLTFTASNQNGQQSVASATVTVTGNGTNGATSISYLSPQSGRVGTQILIVGSGFSQLENTVHFGVGGTLHAVSNNGTTIYFTIPAYVSQCDVMPGTQCFAAQAVTPGTYQMYVTDQNGTSNTISFTVTS